MGKSGRGYNDRRSARFNREQKRAQVSVMNYEEPQECPLCEGGLIFLGALGNKNHFRCRDCGSDCSQ